MNGLLHVDDLTPEEVFEEVAWLLARGPYDGCPGESSLLPEKRLDFLGHALTPDYDLYIAIDSRAGGRRDLLLQTQSALEWDTLLVIPAAGPLHLRRQLE